MQLFSKTIPTFFRGHGQADWKLIPEIGRSDSSHIIEQSLEKSMFLQYSSHAHMEIGEMTSWDVLFSMRHHGLPTRLLDWTDSLFVALFFSIRSFEHAFEPNKNKDLKNPCVWVLRSADLNKKMIGHKGLVYTKTSKTLVYDYFVGGVEGKNGDDFPADVVAVYPPKSNKRLLTQGGLFTFHKILRPLEETNRELLLKIEIDKSQIAEIKKFLYFSGVKESHLFPDLDGLARQLKDQLKHTRKST